MFLSAANSRASVCIAVQSGEELQNVRTCLTGSWNLKKHERYSTSSYMVVSKRAFHIFIVRPQKVKYKNIVSQISSMNHHFNSLLDSKCIILYFAHNRLTGFTCIDLSHRGTIYQVSGIRYSCFTWGTVSQWLLQMAPRKKGIKYMYTKQLERTTNTLKWWCKNNTGKIMI